MRTGTIEGDHFLTVKEVAERLNVCRASIYVWLKDGFPKPLKLGRASR
jgi:excisionase family DNA binding protein